MICDHIDIYKSDKFHSHTKLISYVKDRPGHDIRYAVDPSKLMNELGWKPFYNFKTGLKNTIEWYVSNLSWCEQIMSPKGKILNENESRLFK